MSRENVEIVDTAYEAFNRGDPEAALEFIDQEIEIEYYGERPDLDRSYHGHVGVREVVGQFREIFSGFRAEVEECIDVGDDVVIAVRNRGTGKTSGLKVDVRTGHVWTVRAGKLVRWRLYRSKTEALEAVNVMKKGPPR
jgi:ketosteroid isomerase-like protein